MATENVGGIQYTVDAETSGLIQAEATTKKFTQNTAKSFGQAEAATKKFDTQVTKSAASVKKGIQSNLGQAGIQVQQFVGQLQGGQSAMVALAQQSADLGIVLGAPLVGVFVSLAAVLAGTLAPALFSSTSAIEKMEKAVENTKAVLTIGAYGVANYTEEIRNLATISQDLVKIKLSTAMAEQQKVIQNVGEAAKQAYKDAIPLFNWSFDNSATSTLFGNLVNDKDLERLGSADPLITKARTGIEKLVIAMRTIENGNTARGVEQLTDSLDFLSASAVQNTAAGADLVSQMTKIIEQYKVGKITIEQLKGALDESKGSFSGNAEALQEYLKGIELSTLALKGNERELEKRKLALSGMGDQEQITALAAWDYMKKIEAQTKEQEEAKKADEERVESLKKVNDELDLFFDKESRRSTKKDAQQTATLTRQVQSIGLTPEEEIQAQYERELELLRQAEEKKIQIEGTYAERRKQLEIERMESLRKLNNESLELVDWESFGNRASGALAAGALGLQDMDDAIKGLAQSLITEALGALIQFGIKQAAISAGFITSKAAETAAVTTGIATQAAAATAATGVTTAAGVASGAAITAAMAPAAAATSIATAGAAPAAAAPIALSTIGAIIAGLVGVTALAGAREFGGPVTAGKSYLVGERGPEMFTPGTSGGITSNKDMNGAGGGGMTINISNNTPYEVFVTRDEAANIANVQIGREAGKLSQGKGQMANAMKRGAGTQFNGAN